VLERISGKTRNEVERIVAEYRPRAEVRDQISPIVVKEKKVGTSTLQEDASPAAKRNLFESNNPDQSSLSRCPSTNSGFSTDGVSGEKEAEPVVEKVLFRFSAAKDFEKKFQQAQSLMSHKFARKASLEDVFGVLLDEYLIRHSPVEKEKRRVKRKEKKAGAKKETVVVEQTKNVPARHRDRTFVRGNGRCEYVGVDGVRCNSTLYLQVDHRHPRAIGGGHDASNLRCLCGLHNRAEAKRILGCDSKIYHKSMVSCDGCCAHFVRNSPE